MSGAPHPLLTLATIGGVYWIAVASPGPNFFIASQLALAGRRRLGLRAALGIATGAAIWATLTMVGVATILAQARWLQLAIRIAAALYLAWLGVQLVRGALRGGADGAAPAKLPATPAQAYRAGLATNLTNPKAAAFWTSIFGAMFPVDAPGWMYPATVAVVSGICGGWYGGVALLFSTTPVRRGYARARRPIDGVLGVALLALSAHLALSR